MLNSAALPFPRRNLWDRLRVSLRGPELFYVLFAMLYFVGALSPSDSAESELTARAWQFDALSYVAQFIVFPILLIFIAMHWHSVVRGFKSAFWPLAVSGFAILSAAWAPDPFFTFRRAIIFTATTVFAVYLGSRFDFEDQINFYTWLLILSVLGSLVMVVLAPQYGIAHDMHDGAWKGLFSHKNLLGRQMAFGILTVLVGRPTKVPKPLAIGAAILALPVLAMSHSAGALLTMLVLIGFYVFASLPRRRRSAPPLWLGLLPAIVVFGALVIFNLDMLLELFGRDATFTGRVPLWIAIGHAIGDKPWLGYGYATFWVTTTRALNMVVSTGWNALSSQNGYLDLCLDLGLAGFAIFLVALAVALKDAVKALGNRFIHAPKWPIILILFFALQNLHESDLLRLGTFMWIPFVATAVAASIARKELAAMRVLVPARAANEKSPNSPRTNPSNIPVYGA